MKVINEEKKINVILDEDDSAVISALRGNNIKIIVQNIDGILHVNDSTVEEIDNLAQEKKAISAMNDFLDNK